MASPHVAGVVALYLQTHRTASPAAVRSALVGTSTAGVVRNPGQESPNRLLFTVTTERKSCLFVVNQAAIACIGSRRSEQVQVALSSPFGGNM